jgi:hypothetical protein
MNPQPDESENKRKTKRMKEKHGKESEDKSWKSACFDSRNKSELSNTKTGRQQNAGNNKMK